MRKIRIVIDGGTTNTRIHLCRGMELLTEQKIRLGARLSGNHREDFLQALSEGIREMLTGYGLGESDVEAVIASGMITCETGLAEIPHLPAPAGLKELSDGMVQMRFPEICGLPFYLIPGVKQVGTYYGDMDVMRGEETEIMGICHEIGVDHNISVILPGSHSKVIYLDESGKIQNFSTMLTGEMIAAIASDTILANSLSLEGTLLTDMLYDGYAYAHEYGVNQALFKVRILRQFMKAQPDDVYSFYLGILLCDEVDAIGRIPAPEVYVGGQKQIKEAECRLIRRFTDKAAYEISDEICRKAPTVGAVKIFENA